MCQMACFSRTALPRSVRRITLSRSHGIYTSPRLSPFESNAAHLFTNARFASSPLRDAGTRSNVLGVAAQTLESAQQESLLIEYGSNQALERTADRREDLLVTTSTLKSEAQLGLVSG